MKDSRNLAIVVLVVTAAILAALLVARSTVPVAKAEASAAAGPYIIATGAYSGSKDLLYILDTGTARLNAYVVNPATGMVDIVESVDLQKGFQD